MLKWLKAGALAVMLALPWAVPVGATDNGFADETHVIVTNTTDQLLNAAGETTSTLTAAPFETLTIFISGTYSTANVVQLQREVGSPGSGAFERVFDLDLGTANARQIQTVTNGPNTNGYRLAMTTFGTGAVVAYMTNMNRTARNWLDPKYITTQAVQFDDFFDNSWETNADSETLVSDQKYIAAGGTDNGGVIPRHVLAIREGAMDWTSSTDENDMNCLGVDVLADHGVLPSDGWSSFETRLSVDITAAAAGMGFHDTVCSDTGVWVTAVSGTVASSGAGDSQAIITFQDAATNSTSWLATSAIIDVEGANALEVPMATVATATYVVLRVEIDNLGQAFFYVDGTLQHVEPLAVTTTVEQSPQVFVESSSAGSTSLTLTLDYWYFVKPRPTAPSS